MSGYHDQLLFPEAEPQPKKQMRTACFSGHRLDKLPEGIPRKAILSMLHQEVRYAVAKGVTTFYCGVADGIDLFAADYVRMIREGNPQLQLICVKPFRDFGKKLRSGVQYHYNQILAEADAVIELSDHYYPNCFRVRNQFMIARSDLLIAVMGNPRSGTGQTVRMAQRSKLPVRVIDVAAVEQHISDRPQLVEILP